MPELSTRTKHASSINSFLVNGLFMHLNNPYHVTSNPSGIINFGTAENKLMYDEIHQRLSEVDLAKMPMTLAKYNNFTGNDEFRDLISKLVNHYMKPTIPVSPDNLIVFNGCGPAIEGLAFAICDADEGILIPTPYYGCFKTDLGRRGRTKLCEFNFPENHQNNADVITATLKQALATWQQKGVKVKALLVCNPDNPTGRVYSPEDVEVFLEFCLANDIYAILDEVFFFSVYDETVKMKSVLSLPNFERYKDIVQTTWAFSKDFSISGFRCGVLITYNKELYNHICKVSLLFASSSLSQHIMQHLIDDFDWVDGFVSTNHKRLRKARDTVISVLEDLKVEYVRPFAGLYVWFNLSKYICGQPSEEKDKELFFKLINEGVYIAPGFAFYCHVSGWFRIIFSVDPDELVLGMNRFKEVLLKSVSTDDSQTTQT